MGLIGCERDEKLGFEFKISELQMEFLTLCKAKDSTPNRMKNSVFVLTLCLEIEARFEDIFVTCY